VEQEIARDGVFLNECGGWQLGQEVWDSWLSSEAQTVCKKEREKNFRIIREGYLGETYR